jgi:hypothetical protein
VKRIFRIKLKFIDVLRNAFEVDLPVLQRLLEAHATGSIAAYLISFHPHTSI